MIACKVTGAGKQQKVVLSIPEASGWSDRFPRVRADNGVIVTWWNFETNKPIEKLKWDFKHKTLSLPIPFAAEAEDVSPKQTSVGVEMAGIRIVVPGSTTSAALGTLRVSENSAKLIAYAICKMNEYIRLNQVNMNTPANSDLWADLLELTRKTVSPEAVEKLGEAIEQMGAEIDTRLDAVAEQMDAIKEARSRIDFLRGLRQKWSVIGTNEESDIGL